ncbi:MAG TPA: hypothetical protein VGP12_05085 [Nitrosospira sp.]|nr:hypothetical protein [Nitrosospira sp.]
MDTNVSLLYPLPILRITLMEQAVRAQLQAMLFTATTHIRQDRCSLIQIFVPPGCSWSHPFF